MARKNNTDLYEWMEDLESLPEIRNMKEKASKSSTKQIITKKDLPERDKNSQQLLEQIDREENFYFTYQASHHEHDWIKNSLGSFYNQHWIKDILRLIKGGKEAHVYQCLTDVNASSLATPYIAAKVYRPRRFRNLKNDHLYREGRAKLDEDGHEIIDGGMLHAMNKRTEYGLKLMHTSWIEYEYRTMQILYEAGASVPQPLARGDNAILMTYIGDADFPAPMLNSIELELDEARRLFEIVLENIEIMLGNRIIHGDLSAYNILYWEGEITIIDFPQAINPEQNRNAFSIFERDVKRICEYFSKQGIEVDGEQIAAKIWMSHQFPRFQEPPKEIFIQEE